MSIAINSNFERNQYTATFNGQVNFSYTFPIFSDTYLSVYQYVAGATPDDPTQLLELGVDYTVTGVGQEAGGTIVLTVGAMTGDIITIVGKQPIDRQSVFQDLNPFTVALNQQLNQMTVMLQQVYTYWANLTPHYNFDELVSAPEGNEAGVRPFKLILPMLGENETWVGRGAINEVPDDITTLFIGGAGTGNVISTGDPMRQSIANWTGNHTQITDTNINIVGNLFTPTAGTAANIVTGFDDAWGAFHWPAHVTANRPLAPSDGDTYYDTDTGQFFGYANGMWIAFGTGGNSAVVQTIVRANTFAPQNWVKIDDTGAYVLALGDNASNDDVVGVVISATPTEFTVQQSGYNSTIFTGLDVANHNYFLDTAVPGNMVNVDASVNGQVSRPVFSADSATAGWVLPYRPLIVGGSGGGGSGSTSPEVVTVAQDGHPFVGGEAIRAGTPVGGQEFYELADATSYLNSLAVGFVIQVVNVNQFIYQTSGIILDNGTQAGPLVDDLGAALVPGTPYYLSSTVPGSITSTEPATPNFSRPMFMPTATVATVGFNRGVIWEERSIQSGTTPPPANPTLVQTNSDVPFSTASSGWVDTGICATITLTTALQTVLVMANINLASDGQNGVAFRIVRNGVAIDVGSAAGSRTQASGAGFGTQLELDSGIDLFETFVDSPAAMGTYTYCVEVNRGNSATATVNRGDGEVDAANYFRTSSSIVLMALN